MFLGELNLVQKQAFYQLAKRLMAKDGRAGADESEMLAQMRLEMKLDSNSIDSNLSAESALGAIGTAAFALAAGAGSCTSTVSEEASDAELLALFTSSKARTIALLEMIGLGHADSNYCALEEEFINSMAAAFDVPEIELVALENWVIRQIALVAEARDFMEEGE